MANRVSIESGFRGCILGNMLGATITYYRAKRVPMEEIQKRGIELPSHLHEVFYNIIVAEHYLENKGKLKLLDLGQSLLGGVGRTYELGRQEMYPSEKEGMLMVVDEHESTKETCRKKDNKDKSHLPINFELLRGGKIGGPGSAVHVMPVGLINYNDPCALYEQSFWVSRLTHPRERLAVAGSMAVAIAVKLAVVNGKDPDAILFQLKQELGQLAKSHSFFPSLTLQVMDSVERVYRQKIDTLDGLRFLEREIIKPGVCSRDEAIKLARSAKVVIPKAIYAALNLADKSSFIGMMEAIGVETDEKMTLAERTKGDEKLKKHEIRVQRDSCYKLGALAGSLRATMIGEEGLPTELIQKLEHREAYAQTMTKLYQLAAHKTGK